MKANVDFSVFSSPTEAYANVTGVVELRDDCNIGDHVDFRLKLENDHVTATGINLVLIVIGKRIDDFLPVSTTLSLEEIVVDGDLAAENLLVDLEESFDFYAYRYHE